ncbi:MAG: MFS transporter [Rhodospirillales bacterium]|nr:MFS transporter [Rhodospirillales bacterium]
MTERRTSGSLLAWFSLGHLSNDWAPAAVWLLTPAIAASLALSPAELGLLITIHSVGAALAFLPAGVLADRVTNRGRLLLATFWWVAIGYFAASFAPGFWTLALLLAVAGMGDAAWHPIATGVLVEGMPGRRARALGLHAVGGTLAEVLAPLSVGFLIGFFDWRTTLQLSAVPAALMGLAFFRIAARVPASPHAAISRADFRTLWNAWRRPAGLGMIGTISAYNMAFLALLSMTPLFLQRVHGFSPAETGLVFSSMLLVGAAVQPFVGHLSDLTGRKRVVIVGNLAAAGAALAVALGPGPVSLIAALIATAALLVGIRSAVLAAAVEFAGGREATTLGLAFAVLDGVGALGALLAGAVGSFDLHYAFLLAAGLAVLAAALALPVAFASGAREAAPVVEPVGGAE